jgi:hypothetical protein
MAEPRTTLIEIVNIVARSVGHPSTTDVASSTDEAILRMGYYVNIACMELTYMYNWEFLTKLATISVVADAPDQAEKAFELPTDFKAMIDDTHWDRSTQLPAIGPVNAQDWQWLIVRKTKITTRMMWRIRNKQLWIKSPPVVAENLTFEYLSKNWAIDGDTQQPKDVMSKNSDYHIFPWELVILSSRAKWFENEGYDSTAAWNDFNKAFQYETGTDKGATSLSLVPGTGYPYIDAVKNIPDTGYGSS